MKKTKILVPAAGLLLLGTAASVTGTVAWFSMNTTVNATGMQIRAKSNASFLLIGEESLTTADTIQAQTGDDLTSEDLTVADNAASVYPSKPYLNDANDAFAVNYVATSPTAITTKALAATVANWYTANSNDAAAWGGSGKVINDAALSAFTNYVIKKSVNLTLADGSTKAHNLSVTPTITLKEYYKTTDLDIVGGKTYYTKAGDAYSEVASPVVGDIGSYYEHASGTNISAVKVLVVSDNNVVAILNSSSGKTNLYSGTTTQNLDITDTSVHAVDIYIYYDGTESAVYTNNAANLGGATVDLAFSVDVNE